MFDTLADQMKHDAKEQTNKREQIIRWTVIPLLAVLVFLGLYVAVRAGG